MKTPVPPRSSKTPGNSNRGKAEEKGSAPEADLPMARFRQASVGVFNAPREKVLRAEDREKKKRKKT